MRFSNNITDAEAERLALLAEECGEVVQVIGKILRHGMLSKHPQSGISNRELLEKELGDLQAAVHMMTDMGDISVAEIIVAAKEKAERVRQFLHHQ